jgi:hypothetical protein
MTDLKCLTQCSYISMFGDSTDMNVINKSYRQIEYHSWLIRDNHSGAFGRDIWKSALRILSTCFLDADRKLSHSALFVSCYVRFWYSVSVITLSNILCLFNFSVTSLKISRYLAAFTTNFVCPLFFTDIFSITQSFSQYVNVNFLPQIAFFSCFYIDSFGQYRTF